MIGTRNTARKGFTFLEIMFVVVIIGILLALVGPRLVGRTQEARIATTRAQLQNLENAIKTFEMDTGTFPEDLDVIAEDEDDDIVGFNGPYVDKGILPVDAWEQSFEYKYPGENNKRSFDLWSKGPDKQDNTEDDIVNWKQDKR